MYVLTEITSLPQKAWVVSSATCAEALFAVLHTACRPITQPCASAVGPPGQNGSQLPITLPLIFPFSPIFISFSVSLFHPDPLFVPSLVHVFQGKGECMVHWFACIPNYSSLSFRESVKAVDCRWHAAWFSLSVHWSVKAGQWGPAEEERMICPLLSVGFLCAPPHLNAK